MAVFTEKRKMIYATENSIHTDTENSIHTDTEYDTEKMASASISFLSMYHSRRETG